MLSENELQMKYRINNLQLTSSDKYLNCYDLHVLSYHANKIKLKQDTQSGLHT